MEAFEPDELPAWSLPSDAIDEIALRRDWPAGLDRDWAWGEADGTGVRVCIVDSGVDPGHPLVGSVEGRVTVALDDDGRAVVAPDEEGDVSGHGTACAGIVRSLAPGCEIHSVRVLGATLGGTGAVMLAGLRWAIEQQFDVVNMSLSTRKREFTETLHELADDAYFRRTLLVASAHNLSVDSYPWRFASVISVGSHERADPTEYFYNPRPPVEFFARGVDVPVAWEGGARVTATGNSFATPHISGICALIRSKHPDLTPFQVKHVLYLTSANVQAAQS